MRRLCVLVVLLSSFGCETKQSAPPYVPPIERDPITLLVDADSRVATPAMRSALRSPHVRDRRYAALAFARSQNVDHAPFLMGALRDPDTIVRAYASMGMGSLEDLASPSHVSALVGAYVVEEDEVTRRAMLEDLGRVAKAPSVPVIVSALGEPRLVGSGCKALGRLAMREVPIPADALLRVSNGALSDDREMQLDCLFMLSRATPAAETVIVPRVLQAAESEDEAVRVMSMRALGRFTTSPIDRLVRGMQDPSWRVGVAAVGALIKRDRRSIARGLSRDLDPRVADAALRALIPYAREEAVHALAVEWWNLLEPTDPWRARADCAAALLVDHGRGWPNRVDGCGGERVSEVDRLVFAASVIQQVEGADPQRATYLRRLFERPESRVKQAVIRAATFSEARDLLQAASESDDRGVLNVLLEVLSERAPAERGATDEGGADANQAETGEETDGGTEAWVRAALEHLRAPDDLEGLKSALLVIKQHSLEDSFSSLVEELAAHPNVAVRRDARALLTSAPETSVPSENTIAQSEVVLTGNPRVVITLKRGGEIVFELDRRAAPTTVARFLKLVSDGFYDGLSFHRVIPGFVAQGGDPRGDGYGGPGYAQRCEDNRLDYTRGVVGMALAGRDTGGSQFFITQAALPHLDGRYTAFGRVVTGMENVDGLVPGDVMETVRLAE